MTDKSKLRQYTVSFTGHRELRHSDIAERLDGVMQQLVDMGYRYFGTGGALGFDTEAALAVLRARERYPHIKLIVVAPFPGQERSWSRPNQAQYKEIQAQADKVTYTSARYGSDCFHIRNRALIDGASLCIAYLYKSSGGTAYTVGYAQECGIRVINIAKGGQV